MLHSHQKTGLTGNKLRELLIDGLKDASATEQALIKLLPLYAKASISQELTSTFDLYAAQTEEHICKLKQAFKMLGERPERGSNTIQKFMVDSGNAIRYTEAIAAKHDLNLACTAKKIVERQIETYDHLQILAEENGLTSISNLFDCIINQENERRQILTKLECAFKAAAQNDSDQINNDNSDNIYPMKKNPN